MMVCAYEPSGGFDCGAYCGVDLVYKTRVKQYSSMPYFEGMTLST